MGTIYLKRFIALFILSMTLLGGLFAQNTYTADVPVGSIPGQLSVSSSGAATYTIPIECPVGINGMQPTIALNYNSQAGNGSVGWGWNLGGISSITKGAKNLFSDNVVSGLNLTKEEAYYLDGNRLLLVSGVYGKSGAVYRTENESFSKIVSMGENGNPSYPLKFIVTSKDGTVTEYAQCAIPEKVSSDQPTPTPYQWLITRITDLNGNSVNFTYTTYSSHYGGGSQLILRAITYGTNVIYFNHQPRQHFNKQYVAGYYFNNAYYLSNIEIFDGEIELARYNLNYTIKDKNYFLTSVGLQNEAEENMNPITIDWGNDNKFIAVNYTSTNNPSSYHSDITNRVFTVGDIDGDGKDELIEYFHRDDYIYRYENSYRIYNANDHVKVSKVELNNGTNPQIQSVLNRSLGASFDLKDFKNFNGGTHLASFNGTQKKTILTPSFYQAKEKTILLVNDIKSFEKREFNLKSSSELPAFVVGDVNNDGIDEIIYLEKVKSAHVAGNGAIAYIKKNTKNVEFLTAADKISATQPITFKPIPIGGVTPQVKDIMLVDMNADGLNDIVVMTTAGMFFLKNNGGVKNADGIVIVSFTQLPTYYSSLAVPNDFTRVKSGDFNGDGMLDFLHYNGKNNFTLCLNNGNFGFTNHTINNISLIEDADLGRNSDRNDNKDDFMVADFNHDGKSDIIIVDANYEKKCSWRFLGACMNPYATYVNTTIKWFASNGETFTQTKSITIKDEDYYYKGYMLTGDFDGDGRSDIFSYRANLYYNNKKEDNGFFHTSFNANFDANQVKAITDGYGNKTQIRYQPLTYTKKSDNTDFYKKVQQPCIQL